MNNFNTRRTLRSATLAIVASAALALVGCAAPGTYSNPYGSNGGYGSAPSYGANPNYGNNGYNQGYGGNQYNNPYNNPGVRYGTVYNMRTVPVQTDTSGAGIGIGAVAGGVLGNQIGKGSGRTAATILGAVGGGFLGNEIEKRNYRTVQGVELQVEVEGSREMITVVQPDQGQNFRIGSRVRLVEQNGRWVAQ